MKTQAKPGDFVEVHLSKIIYEGTLLESPEDEKGIVLLKLGSGYNIGLSKKDVLDIKLLKRASEKKDEIVIKKDSKKPTVALILTGGTIASRYDPKTGGVDSLEKPSDLFKYYPELFRKVNVAKVETPFMKDSSEMHPKDWKKIAQIAEKLLNDPEIKGLIITHGTDTLHYTSAALSFFLRNLSKPVVLTYSQRSTDRASSDANLNLQCAALAAVSDIAEVMLVGHATTNDDFCYAIPGAKVRKLHSSMRNAFKPVNTKPFAKITPDRLTLLSDFNHRKKENVQLDAKYEEKVALIRYYPGEKPDILEYYLKEGYKGVVIETVGIGQLPGSWMKTLKEVQEKGLIICATTQTIFGRADPFIYANGRRALKTGVLYLEDMLSEVALIKLGWVLGHKEWAKTKEIIQEKMLQHFSHEISPRLTYVEE